MAWATLLLAGLLVAGAPLVARAAGAGPGSPATPRAARLAAALDAPALRGARIAALVVRRGDGGSVFARDPERALVPASNVKLLTALAALAHFGPAHRFTTRVLADAPLDAEGAVGTLYVQGGGDPVLNSEDWWRLAADLRRIGLRRVRDALVLDDGVFDHERWLPGWGEVSARAYHAPIGALSANYATFTVEVRPGLRPGDPVRVSLDPPVPYLSLVQRAVTVPRGTPDTLGVSRGPAGQGETVLVSGSVPVDAPNRLVPRSVADPTRYAGAVLRMQLEAQGIALPAQTRVGSASPGSTELLAFAGRPLAEVVRLLAKFSNNAIAESLVKALAADVQGGPGSWPRGLEVLRGELAAQGLDTRGLELADGSGLSYANRASPALLVAALRRAQESFSFGPELVAALPIAGADGTLRQRARSAHHAVRAKTGLLDRVVALSGYASTEDGEELVFSLLVNGHRAGDDAAMAAVDAFAAALVAPSEAPATANEADAVFAPAS